VRSLGVRAQLLLVLLVPLVLFAPVTVVVFHRTLQREVGHQVDARADIIAKEAAPVLVDDVLTGDRIAAERRLADIRNANAEIAYVFVVDPHGQLVAHSFREGFPADLLAVHAPRPTGDAPQPVELEGRPVHDVRAPMLGGRAGWVHLGMFTDVAAKTHSAVILRVAGIGIGVVVVGVALALLFSSRMLRRLDQVSRAAKRVGEGSFETGLRDLRDDEIGRLCVSFDDMAQRLRLAKEQGEQTMQQLAHSESLVAVGRLAAGLAHEINNPLSGALHCIENLKSDDQDEAQRREYYGLMAEGIGRAQTVIRRLLDFSKQHALEARDVDVRLLVDQVVSLAQPALAKQRVRTAVRHEEALPLVTLDPHQMAQVFLNLVLNGAEAMSEGGTLAIETSALDGQCRIRVRDEGCGIAPEAHARIFEPFFTTKGRSQGSGLGLSVSLGIVQRHGGRILVDSTPGRGSTFDVLLPLTGAGADAAARAEGAAGGVGDVEVSRA
jgi:signal transduction histidine kinase